MKQVFIATQMTAEGCLEEALRHEETAKACGPHDPAFEFLCNEVDWWLREAALLEQRSM